MHKTRQIHQLSTALLLSALAGIVGYPLAPPVAAGQSGHGYSPLPTVHERFATFISGDGFKSVLLLENFRQDVPITVTPSLILDKQEVPLDPIALSPHSTTTVDISGFLSSHGFAEKWGTVVTRYSFSSYGPVNAVVENVDEAHELYLNSYSASPEEYWSGTTMDAVIWTPEKGTQGYISITNTTNESRLVRTTFLVDGHSEERPPFELAPRSARILSIDDLVSHAGQDGAGIHVEGGEYPGDLLVEGQLFNKRTGFTKRIHFIDRDLQVLTGTLRTHFLLLGSQPVEDGFPAEVRFRSVAAVRNIYTAPVTVTPVIKFLRNGSLESIRLNPLHLDVGQSRTVDFSDEQRSGRLPQGLHQASLELIPDVADSITIVGELFNFNERGDYVVGPSLNSYPARSTASIWRTDGTFQTTVIVENTADKDDRLLLKLFSDDGTYIKTFTVPSGGLLKVNVRDLQRNAVPDDNGKFLTGTSGVMSMAGSHNTRSKLAYDKIIHSANEADYVGYPPNPCDYVSAIQLFADTSTGQGPFPVMAEYDWSISGPVNDRISGTSSSNSSLAQISTDTNGFDLVTFTPPDDGQEHSVSISSNPLSVTNCEFCSGGYVTVGSANAYISLHRTTYKYSFIDSNNICVYNVYCITSPHICGADTTTVEGPCPYTYFITYWIKLRIGQYSTCFPGPTGVLSNTWLACY